MWGRLLTNAALLLAAIVGSVAMANEPGTETGKLTKKEVGSSAQLPVKEVLEPHEDEPIVPDATVPSRPLPGRSPRVLIITDKDSKACQRELDRLSKSGGSFAAMKAKGWKIGPEAENHVQFIDRNEVPHLIQQLDAREFPVVACVADGDVVRSFKDGCSTPLDAWTFSWLLKGISERPQAPIPEAVRVATTGSYPLRGNHWSVDGNSNPTKETLVSHLRAATHVNYLKAEWKLEDWSTEELRSLHDDLHERYGPAAPSTAAGNAPTTGLEQFSGNRKALGKF